MREDGKHECQQWATHSSMGSSLMGCGDEQCAVDVRRAPADHSDRAVAVADPWRLASRGMVCCVCYVLLYGTGGVAGIVVADCYHGCRAMDESGEQGSRCWMLA